MADQSQLIAERGAQMFPQLAAAEIERVRRFGQIRHYAKGDALVTTGQPGDGAARR